MIFITSTTDTVKLVTSTAATVDVMASFIDAATLTGVTAGLSRQATAISSATTTTVVSAPGASVSRNVAQLTARNRDASLSVDVTVTIDISATAYELFKATLAPGDTLQYIEGVGFFVLVNVAKLDKCLYVTADSVHATAATFAGITGLSVPVKTAKVYTFIAHLYHIGNATTTGAQFAIGGVAMTFMIAGSKSTVLNSVTASTESSGVVTAVDTAVIVQTTGAAANAPTIVSGSFQPSADGTFLVKATSEVTVAAGLTVRKGSFVRIRETDN